ncbi:MAG: asparaginase domain-containing protein [Gammaproteobacteria bacterium]|nr:asparaginase domain-containing protein [Gammaproteobacteria bacterium]MDH3767190.1 asparaginase domain-containing protein [Gammaproteobacteria bacterium]
MPDLTIITTGGTIDKVYFDQKSRFEIGSTQIDEILREAQVQIAYEIVSLMQKDSLDLADADRAIIRDAVAACNSTKILVTHGTDTMTDTAAVLNDIEGKTIVLTGALSPARFRSTDASFNVGMAIAALQSLSSGVYIVMNGEIFPAGTVTKNRELNRFERIG